MSGKPTARGYGHALGDPYVVQHATCSAKSCNITQFLRENGELCEAIEFLQQRNERVMLGNIKMIGEIWTYKNCTFTFKGGNVGKTCPQMPSAQCYVYNGGICCATKCPALEEIGKELRQSLGFRLCSNGFQLVSKLQSECLYSHVFPAATCKDEMGNRYFEGATWVVNRCTACECKHGILRCVRDHSVFKTTCKQPRCKVWEYIDPSRPNQCKVCKFEGKLYETPTQWKSGGVKVYCYAVKYQAGCHLRRSGLFTCTGSYPAIKRSPMFSSSRYFLCRSGDQIIISDIICNGRRDCKDGSDEVFCPSRIFRAKCMLRFSRTTWDSWCFCEDKVLVENFEKKIVNMNVSTVTTVFQEVINRSTEFTNARQLLHILDQIIQKAKLFLRPITKDNDDETTFLAEVGNFVHMFESGSVFRFVSYQSLRFLVRKLRRVWPVAELRRTQLNVVESKAYKGALCCHYTTHVFDQSKKKIIKTKYIKPPLNKIQLYLELGLQSTGTVAMVTAILVLSCIKRPQKFPEKLYVHKNLMLSLSLANVVYIVDVVFTKKNDFPVNLVLFFVFLRIVFGKLSQRFAHNKVKKARKRIKCVAALLPLLGVTWLLGFTVESHWILAYIFIIINSSQAYANRAEQSRAEQSRAEQSRAEQSRAEQSRAEQSRAEQSRAEQSRAEQQQSRAEQSRAEQSRAEQSRAEQSRAEQSRAEQSRAEQSRAEQSRAEQSRAQHRAQHSTAESSTAQHSIDTLMIWRQTFSLEVNMAKAPPAALQRK
ncbi:hypothetical protein QZH41_014017 [Actinostola sp. cb2023]|nr:hypothetical protein QZH41_014017 [Actinostola sp. cb2023]